MMGSLFLKGPEIDLTDLPKIATRYFRNFRTLEYMKTKKKQAQRRAAGDRSGRKYSKIYIMIVVQI